MHILPNEEWSKSASMVVVVWVDQHQWVAGFIGGWLSSSMGGWVMGGFVGRSVCSWWWLGWVSWWWVWVLPGASNGCGLG